MSNVRLQKLSITLGGNEIIRELDLAIEDGEFLVLLGPSGCGKSTLLHSIAGLIDVSSGTVEIGGEDMTWADPSQRHIGMVFQSYALYPTMTVEKNMSFGLRINGTPKAEIARRIKKAAEMLHLEPLLQRKPAALSGGQRQRVAIGRALVREAGVFLFDEPLSNLDAKLRAALRRELKLLHLQLHATMIYVTHDQVEAMTLADKIVVLKDGLVQQIGSPMELYHHPANAFVAGFLGSPGMNFLEVDVKEVNGDRATVSNAALDPVTLTARHPGIKAGGKARLGLRPQYLSPDADAGAGVLHGKIALTERLGSETIVEAVTTDGKPLIVALARDAVFEIGTPISLRFDPETAHLFAL